MFCPQCSVESSPNQHYCRSCGTNLKVIGKAVTLSEAISRSDGVPGKIKEMMQNIKLAHVTDEVSAAMDKVNKEIISGVQETREHRRRHRWSREKTPEQRRERHLTKGVISLFWGGGLTTFLYFVAHALVLKLPPDVINNTPFEIDPLVRVLWLVGLIPMLSGLGHILAGLMIRRSKTPEIEVAAPPPLRIDYQTPADEATIVAPRETPASVTDRTTNILHRNLAD